MYPVTQQYYLRARFYNPVIGRFTQEDTYYGDGLNLYQYCQANPVGYVDPSGHNCGTTQSRYNSDEEQHPKANAAGGYTSATEKDNSKSGGNTHVPSANTQVVRHPEIKSPNQVKMSDVTNYWDDYLGSNQTNIHPRTGLVDNDRIFSADGTKSIRFGNHEMDSMGTTKFHFHLEEWKYDPVNDVMEYFNTLVRIKR